MEYFFLALMGLLGVMGHFIVKWFKHKGGDWIWFSKPHVKRLVFGVFVIGVFLLLKDEIGDLFPMTKSTMFMLGYLTDSAFKNFTDTIGKKIGL